MGSMTRKLRGQLGLTCGGVFASFGVSGHRRAKRPRGWRVAGMRSQSSLNAEKLNRQPGNSVTRRWPE